MTTHPSFQALPLAVLQYINNGINSSWYHEDGSHNYFLIISFVASLATITIHSITLLILLYDENIEAFYNTLRFLKKIKKREADQENQNQSKKAEVNLDDNGTFLFLLIDPLHRLAK